MRGRSLTALLPAALIGFCLSTAWAQSTDKAGTKATTPWYSVFGFGEGEEDKTSITIPLEPEIVEPDPLEPDADGAADGAPKAAEESKTEPAEKEAAIEGEPEGYRTPSPTSGKIDDKVETRRYSIFDWGNDEDTAEDSAEGGSLEPKEQGTPVPLAPGPADKGLARQGDSPLNLLPGEDWLRGTSPLASPPEHPELTLEPAKPDAIWPTLPGPVTPRLESPGPETPDLALPQSAPKAASSSGPSTPGRRKNPLAGLADGEPPQPAAAASSDDDHARVVALPPGAAGPSPAAPASRPSPPGTKRLGDALDELMTKNPVVARVNGSEILWADVMNSARDLPDRYQSQVEVIFPALLDRLIDLELLSTAARADGLGEEDEVQRRVRDFETQLLRELYLQRLLADRLSTSSLRQRYDRIAAEVKARHEVRARHIQLETREEAIWVIAQLDEGANFAWLAKQHSTSASAERGGDLGYFDPSRMPAGFSEAAYTLAEGTYSQIPVETAFGWHVIELIARRSNEMPSFFQLREQLREDLAKEIVAEIVGRLRGEADLQIFPDESGLAPEAAENDTEALPEITN